MTFPVLSSAGHIFHSMPLEWDLSYICIIIRVRVWRRKTTEIKCHFHPITSRAPMVNIVITADVDLDHLTRVVFVRFSTAQLLSPVLYYLERSHSVKPTLAWGLYSPLWEWNLYIINLKVFCKGNLSPLHKLFIYQSCIYVSMDALTFILYTVSLYNATLYILLLKLF